MSKLRENILKSKHDYKLFSSLNLYITQDICKIPHQWFHFMHCRINALSRLDRAESSCRPIGMKGIAALFIVPVNFQCRWKISPAQEEPAFDRIFLKRRPNKAALHRQSFFIRSFYRKSLFIASAAIYNHSNCNSFCACTRI